MEPIQQSFRYDVFLSFRGEDTCYNFTSHLHRALIRHDFEVFHDTSLPRGRSIGPQLLAAINESKIFVVVFSTNYADSKWCLNELTQMMHCMHKNTQQIVLPVFLDVNQSDVGTQEGSYKQPFTTHDIQSDEETVMKWREALKEAGQLFGLHLQHDVNGDRGRLVDLIVGNIRKIIYEQDSNIADSLVGIGSRIQEVISLLNVGSIDVVDDDIRVVAICGPAVIGKTTIAEATYKRLAIDFKAQYCCFLPDVNTIFREPNGKVKLQKMFISNLILNDKSQIRIDSYNQGTGRIQRMIKHQKVLLVLDDVDNVEQLNILGINSAIIGRGSRIIVTTRDASIFGLVKLDATYEPRLLNDNESFVLFCLNAFGQKKPKEGYEEMSRKAAFWGAGNAGVLKDMASRLSFFESVQYWEWSLKDLRHNSSR